jgi:AcrR family transcriptional regulator
MARNVKAVNDTSTEEKIKAAAHAVFKRKGFAATRTRDIADESGLNLALLNYYFRSKEKLFDIVMKESIQQFFKGITGILNNTALSLNEKVSLVAENYIDMLSDTPDLPLFILSEIKANPERLAVDLNAKEIIMRSHLFEQLCEATGGRINPVHFIINIISLTVFPFVASPLFRIVGDLKPQDFNKLVEERKKMIPMWIDAMLKVH